MKGLTPVFLCLWIGVICNANAQHEFQLFTGYYDPGSDLDGTTLETGALWGFRIGTAFTKVIGTEFSYTFVNNLIEKRKHFSGSAHLINGDLVVQVPIVYWFVPFAVVGLGAVLNNDANQFMSMQRGWAWDFGGGFKVRQLKGPLGFRFDLRYFQANNGTGLAAVPPRNIAFDYAEGSGGLMLTW